MVTSNSVWHPSKKAVAGVLLLALALALPAAADQAFASFKWTNEPASCGAHPVAFTPAAPAADNPTQAWSWDFGDGATSALEKPQHTYASPGDYDVSLTITDSHGQSATSHTTVTAKSEAPCSTTAQQQPSQQARPPSDSTDAAQADSDIDGDGIQNSRDNCPNIANPTQTDLDGDGIGDLCDADIDRDGVPNASDNCPDTFNPNQVDSDADGHGDACQGTAAAFPIPSFAICMVASPSPLGACPLSSFGDATGALAAASPSSPARGVQSIGATSTHSSPTAAALLLAGLTLAGTLLVSWSRAAQRTGRSVGAGGLGASLVGLFSRFSGDQVLDHPSRKLLVECIRERPGIHFRALQRAVGTGSASVQYHLQMLLKAGFVHRHEWKGAVGYYAEGVAAMPGHDTMRSETARSILEQILTQPGSTASDIATRLDCDPSLVSYHLRQFQAAGLIDRVTSAGSQRIVARPAAAALGISQPLHAVAHS